MRRAAEIFSLLFVATTAILIHAFIPFVFEKTSSNIIQLISKKYIE
jgi:hypothetical protein